MARTLHGAFDLNANCDALNAEIIETALTAEMTRDLQAADPRRTAQRRLDALVNICRRDLDRGESEVHGVRPHVTAVIHINQTTGDTTDLVARARAERHSGGRLSQTMIELLTCDCNLSRIILAGRSEILDVGRATPTVTPAQWKALAARDGHCQAPGCNRPPSDCQAHHIRHWTHGGPTDLENLKLLCWYHHRQQHIHDAQTRAHNTNRDPSLSGPTIPPGGSSDLGSGFGHDQTARRYAGARGDQSVLDVRDLVAGCAANLADDFGDAVHAVEVRLAE
jgi:hypothetical protein